MRRITDIEFEFKLVELAEKKPLFKKLFKAVDWNWEKLNGNIQRLALLELGLKIETKTMRVISTTIKKKKYTLKQIL